MRAFILRAPTHIGNLSAWSYPLSLSLFTLYVHPIPLAILSLPPLCRGLHSTTAIVATAAAAIVSKYHAPINHREHRILYLQTIRERWWRRYSMGAGWGGGSRLPRSKLTRRRLFYFPPQGPSDPTNRWKSSTQFCRTIHLLVEDHNSQWEMCGKCQGCNSFYTNPNVNSVN